MDSLKYVLIFVLIVLSALFSGLTIGMFTLDIADLERKAKNGNTKAQAVLKIRKNGNMLLCTLLIGNSLVNSALSMTIGDSFGGPIALVISTTLLFLFGELLPQVAFSRNALNVGSFLAPMMNFFLYTFWIITKPISLALDKIFGTDVSKYYDKGELKDFIKSHEQEGEIIDADERRIMIGAMTFSEKTAFDVMTPASVVTMFEANKVIPEHPEFMYDLHSRIPIWEERTDNIVSILLTKKMYGAEGKLMKDIANGKVIKIREDLNLDLVLNTMIKEKIHLTCVYNEFGTFLGVVTMEDVLEEIMKVEIMDETDEFINMRDVAEEQAPELVSPEEKAE